MTGGEVERVPDVAQSALRRTRARRVVAFAGMLTAVVGLVGVRAALTPAPTQALGSSGLAAEAGTNGTTGSAPKTRHRAAEEEGREERSSSGRRTTSATASSRSR